MFKTDDIVEIIKPEDPRNWSNEIEKYVGRQARIISYTDIGGEINYTLDVDNGRWAWYPEELILVVSENKRTYKNLTEVEI